MKIRFLIAMGILLVLLAGCLLLRTGASEGFHGTKQLQRQLFESKGRMTPAEQSAGWREVKQRWNTFTDAERQALMRQFEQHEKNKLAQFKQLTTDAEREAFLDAELAIWANELQRKRSHDQAAAVNGRGGSPKATKAEKKVQEKDLAVGKEAKERHYLDSTSPELRAYHAALKERWFEKYEKQ